MLPNGIAQISSLHTRYVELLAKFQIARTYMYLREVCLPLLKATHSELTFWAYNRGLGCSLQQAMAAFFTKLVIPSNQDLLNNEIVAHTHNIPNTSCVGKM